MSLTAEKHPFIFSYKGTHHKCVFIMWRGAWRRTINESTHPFISKWWPAGIIFFCHFLASRPLIKWFTNFFVYVCSPDYHTYLARFSLDLNLFSFKRLDNSFQSLYAVIGCLSASRWCMFVCNVYLNEIWRS